MPEQLTDDQFNDVLSEPDTFKLAIRGLAAIEGDLNTYIEAAFVVKPPGGMRQFGGFRQRLAIAVALGILAPEAHAPVTELARVRHAFAHGDITTLDTERARALDRSFASFFGDASLDTEPLQPREVLQLALLLTRTLVRAGWARVQIERSRRDMAATIREAVSETVGTLGHSSQSLRERTEPGG
jgi:hypothetical protein